jgi:hypothetical protein
MSEQQVPPVTATRTVTAAREAVPERLRWAGAALMAAAVACLVYGLDRSRAVWFEVPTPPQNVIASARIPYFFRMAMAGFLGTIAFAAWAWLARERAERGFSWALRFSVVALAVSCALSVLWP